jgi:hypothetical protein
MTIASKAFGAIGPKIFSPEGPLGASSQFPFPQFDFGEVVKGDKESEFIYLQLIVEASLTLNQGDVLIWDNTFSASVAVAAAGAAVVGSGVGTFFLGGRFGDPASAPNANAGNIWSFTFAPGVYGVWAQRFGASLVNYTGGITAQGDTSFTTATAGAIGALAAAGTHGATIPGIFPAASSVVFTATTTSGSNVLTVVSSGRGLVKGMPVSGAGLSAGCFIADIGAGTVTLGNTLNTLGPAATATSSAVTITANNGAMWATFVTGALTAKVSGVFGVYPNATISGTGVPGSTELISIAGNPGNQTATLNAAFTATEATPVLLTATNYVEGFLRLPSVTVQS